MPLANRTSRRPRAKRDADPHLLGRDVPAHHPLRAIVHAPSRTVHRRARLSGLLISDHLDALRPIPRPTPSRGPRRALLTVSTILRVYIALHGANTAGIRLHDESRIARITRGLRASGPTARLPAARGHLRRAPATTAPATRLGPTRASTLVHIPHDAPKQRRPQPAHKPNRPHHPAPHPGTPQTPRSSSPGGTRIFGSNQGKHT